MPKGARAIAEQNPFAAIETLNSLRRPLTKDEKAYLAKTSDAKFQAVRDGEPAQNDVNLRFIVPLAGGNVSKVLHDWVEEIVLPAASATAKHAQRELVVTLERWAIERLQRGGRKQGTEAGKGLENLTAKYQFAVYVTDSVEKRGFLTLATVDETGRVTRKYADPAAEARRERARKAALAGAAKRKARKEAVAA